MENKAIDNRLRPQWLPQISAPFEEVVKSLDDQGIAWKQLDKTVDQLKPLQSLVDSESIGKMVRSMNNGDVLPPIFIAGDDEILDGHHRFAAYKHPSFRKNGIPCIKIMADYRDAARILNKIQDLFDYNKRGEKGGLETLDSLKGGKTEIVCYRQNPLKNGSASGNFFSLQKDEDCKFAFKIEFDNCLMLDDEEIQSTTWPCLYLAKKWFPESDLESKAREYGLDFKIFINRLVAKTAKSKGHDGICYGTKLLQALPQ